MHTQECVIITQGSKIWYENKCQAWQENKHSRAKKIMYIFSTNMAKNLNILFPLFPPIQCSVQMLLIYISICLKHSLPPLQTCPKIAPGPSQLELSAVNTYHTCLIPLFLIKIKMCDLSVLPQGLSRVGSNHLTRKNKDYRNFWELVIEQNYYSNSNYINLLNRGFPGGASGKESTCQCRRPKRCGFDPSVGNDPLEEGMATHSSIVAWRIPWTEEPGGLQSRALQRVGHNWTIKHACIYDHRGILT